MEASNKLPSLQNPFNIPLNVGFAGGDLPARYFAAAVVLFLMIAAAPPLKLSYGTLKIFDLLASMSGTILLMAGLVFSQKTHYAGGMLILTALLMMWLSGREWSWLAVILGVIVLGWMLQNLLTKRCGINKLLGIDSCQA
jgi:cell division protein FtsW (lipid II flippase)